MNLDRCEIRRHLDRQQGNVRQKIKRAEKRSRMENIESETSAEIIPPAAAKDFSHEVPAQCFEVFPEQIIPPSKFIRIN